LSKRAHKDLRSEVDIYLSLDHPHVAQLEMVYETQEMLHLVMECMEGGELFDRVAEKGRLEEAAAAKSTRQMLLALSYIHEHGVAHRDLKPENFLYERQTSDNLKLIDFGLAKFAAPHEKMSRSCGSCQYVAPEVLNQSYTQKADLWSIGVIVYVMLTGRVLWKGSRSEVQTKIRSGMCEYSSHFFKLSPDARDFVQSLLVPNPASRSTSHQALRHPWLQNRMVAKLPLQPTLLTNLRQYSRTSPCKKRVALLMAWSLTMDDQACLGKQFAALDKNSVGTISLQDFKAALEDKFTLQNKQEAEVLFKSLDIDGNKKIEYREFLAVAALERAKFQDRIVQKAFAHFDRNGDGMVSKTEFVRVLGGSCAKSEIEQFFKDADTSGDGNLSYKEFESYVTKDVAHV